MLDNLDLQVPIDHVENVAIRFSELIDVAFLRRILQVGIKSVAWTELSQVKQFQQVLETWIQQKGKKATYKKLFEQFSLYSIFCGRNPLVNISVETFFILFHLQCIFVTRHWSGYVIHQRAEEVHIKAQNMITVRLCVLHMKMS